MKTITSFCGLSLLLALGKFIRSKIEFFQLHHVPSSIIAGILGLMIIQISGDILPNYWTAGWSRLPVFLINIVFAAFPLGSSIPSFSSIWKRAGPQFVYGQIVAWGQYIIGIGLVLVMLGPLFTVPDLFGIIIPVGFEGGPGTAGGLRETFLQLGWAEGVDFSLASATVGVISAIIAGTALIHWAIKNGYISTPHKKNPLLSGETDSLYTLKAPSQMDAQSLSATSTSNFTLHVAIIGVSILIGYSLRFILVMIEKHALGLIQMKVFTLFPLFPLSMIGGLIVQFFLSRLSINSFQINNASVQQISGTAMDFLIISAISTIKVKIIVKKIIPFLLIITAGILWNIFCVMWLAPKILPTFWFERAIAELGQSMGITVTGLLLLRIVDPELKTDAFPSFVYKQFLHELFMGGGLWTTTAVLLVGQGCGRLVLKISILAIVLWLLVGRTLLSYSIPT